MKKNEKLALICLVIGITFSFLSIKLISDDWFEAKFLNYIVEHQDDITHRNDDINYYVIDTCYMYYYDDITIKSRGDSSLYIIFWGDRSGTWMWDFKKDKSIDFNIPYLRSKGENVEKYIEVLEALK